MKSAGKSTFLESVLNKYISGKFSRRSKKYCEEALTFKSGEYTSLPSEDISDFLF